MPGKLSMFLFLYICLNEYISYLMNRDVKLQIEERYKHNIGVMLVDAAAELKDIPKEKHSTLVKDMTHDLFKSKIDFEQYLYDRNNRALNFFFEHIPDWGSCNVMRRHLQNNINQNLFSLTQEYTMLMYIIESQHKF